MDGKQFVNIVCAKYKIEYIDIQPPLLMYYKGFNYGVCSKDCFDLNYKSKDLYIECNGTEKTYYGITTRYKFSTVKVTSVHLNTYEIKIFRCPLCDTFIYRERAHYVYRNGLIASELFCTLLNNIEDNGDAFFIMCKELINNNFYEFDFHEAMKVLFPYFPISLI